MPSRLHVTENRGFVIVKTTNMNDDSLWTGCSHTTNANTGLLPVESMAEVVLLSRDFLLLLPFRLADGLLTPEGLADGQLTAEAVLRMASVCKPDKAKLQHTECINQFNMDLQN